MADFPPATLSGKIKWTIYPWFPRFYMSLYDKDGKLYEFIDDEIQTLVKSRTVSIVKASWSNGSKTIAVLGGDPFVYAKVQSPAELFGQFTMQWTMTFGFILYTLFMVGMITGLIENVFFSMFLLILMAYMVMTSRVKFQTPSIQYVVLHEYGSIEGYQAYVPGPLPQSRLSMSQIIAAINEDYNPQMIKDKMVRELMRELEVSKEIINRLYGVIVRIERQSDKIYDSTYRLAMLMTADVIEETKKRLEGELKRKARVWLVAAVVSLVVGLAIGFSLGTSVGVGVQPP